MLSGSVSFPKQNSRVPAGRPEILAHPGGGNGASQAWQPQEGRALTLNS